MIFRPVTVPEDDGPHIVFMQPTLEGDIRAAIEIVTNPPMFSIQESPPAKWEFDLVGDGHTMIIKTNREIPWLRRLRCRIFLGSKFKRLDQ